ncbi:unnamed protein product [Fraxinus pennsylvanica]|uniref:BAH domain-containing protein n=1 Tax=Fraxinus pennsylvanica TaxID=56036 RepID=A0AAD2AGC3_9LAMI|nr:unnamed protein product [Fraxinus pennsylvanica]
MKPYVAILKDITQTQDGAMMVTGHWFYHLEDAKKKKNVMAEIGKHVLGGRYFIVSTEMKNLQNMFCTTDREYDDEKYVIDLLVQKTISRLGDLPDIEPGDNFVDQEDQRTKKLLLGMRNMSPLNVSREDGGIFRSHQSVSAEIPGRTESTMLSYHNTSKKNDGKEKRGVGSRIINKISRLNLSDMSFVWPNAAVNSIVALEKAAHDGLSSDSKNSFPEQCCISTASSEWGAGTVPYTEDVSK